jgi:hypothetical protein
MSKIRALKGQPIGSFFRMIRRSKDQNLKNQNIEKNIKSQKGNIRTSKVLIHFLAKNIFNVLILPTAPKKIRTSKVQFV